MGTWEIIGGISALVTIIGGLIGTTKAGRKWIKSRKLKRTDFKEEKKQNSLTIISNSKNRIGGKVVVDEIKKEETRLLEPKGSLGQRWDLFICHAGEDKDDFVRPLAERLVLAGLKVWYDDFSLKVGDSLRKIVTSLFVETVFLSFRLGVSDILCKPLFPI